MNPISHLEGGEISLPILGTARLRNGFDRKREYTYVEYRRANEFQERPEWTIGTQKTAIRQKTLSASKISIGAACSIDVQTGEGLSWHERCEQIHGHRSLFSPPDP